MLSHFLHLCLLQEHFARQKSHTCTHKNTHRHTLSHTECVGGELVSVRAQTAELKTCEQLLGGAYTRKIDIYCTGMYERRPWLIRRSGHKPFR